MTPDSKPLPGAESVDSSRHQTREGADALARSIGESDGKEGPTGSKSKEAASKITEVAKEASNSARLSLRHQPIAGQQLRRGVLCRQDPFRRLPSTNQRAGHQLVEVDAFGVQYLADEVVGLAPNAVTLRSGARLEAR